MEAGAMLSRTVLHSHQWCLCFVSYYKLHTSNTKSLITAYVLYGDRYWCLLINEERYKIKLTERQTSLSEC